jgi:hypothetical protein
MRLIAVNLISCAESVVCALDQSQGIVVHWYQSQNGCRGAVLPGAPDITDGTYP